MAVDADGIHLADLDFWARPPAERDEVFARLRASRGPVLVPESRGSDGTLLPGFYALTRYDQITEVSRNPLTFSSEPSAASLDDPPPQVRELVGSMISMDDPRHARLRRIVSRAFTPRMIKRVNSDVAVLAARIVDALIERGPCDFVTEAATPLPLKIICSMMGVPDSEYDSVTDATNHFIAALGDPDYAGPAGEDRSTIMVEKVSYLHDLMHRLATERRARPADDLITTLVSADVDGEALNDQELGKFFVLLVAAGNETTRNTIAHGLALLTEHPDQRAMLLEDLEGRLPGAVEEIVRYATPVTWMRRNLTSDAEVLGHTYRAGDRVILYYNSANRDEAVFADPYTFDITRSPNRHVGFGGPGPHFCLGAHLARREVTVMLHELLTRVPGIHATAKPIRQRTSFVNGVVSLPCAF
jgi:methyl-branched lipid omega-hydroxylase